VPARAEDVDLAQLVAQAPDAVIFANLNGVVRTWNPAAERIFGLTAEAMIGESLDRIVPERFREAHWTGYDRALAAGETKYSGQSLPTKALHGSGEEITVELSFSIVRGADGTVIGALALARDITERFERDRETRRRLRDLEAELESLRHQA
jgi:PAS domain S-box-containing protein